MWHLHRITSDHCPILLKLTNKISPVDPKPFRFEPIWTLNKDYLEVVKQARVRHVQIEEKLGETRNALTEWNKNYFGNVYAGKDILWPDSTTLKSISKITLSQVTTKT